MSGKRYIPALRYKWLTPLYDFFINLTMPEKQIKQALIEAAYISSKAKVLDFGCGTATLTIMIKELCPEAKVTGIDVDREILDKAIKKVNEKKLDIFYWITMEHNYHLRIRALIKYFHALFFIILIRIQREKLWQKPSGF